ncbi:uncharacterized protein LOC135926075 isoform X2 [Gordionus sp. m RMFG-2023]|uniref:uncharacterized protein LOC135926075 isoform X2 n=1 Tax=Gordionus sp. m RMFG-2023 TaxID=3053472 RepID=UPI0031FDE2E8
MSQYVPTFKDINNNSNIPLENDLPVKLVNGKNNSHDKLTFDEKIEDHNLKEDDLQSFTSDNSNSTNESNSISDSDSELLASPEPLLWLKQQMKANNSPQKILEILLPNKSFSALNNYESWDMILQILTQPSMFKRSKLSSINTIDDFVNIIDKSSNILVLTGAGVSVSCGIPDFRSKDGLYARLAKDFPNLPDAQAMFDINYFKYDPRPFFKFAKEIYPGKFKPSLSHQFIKYLEKNSKLLRNYTQNIDTLEKEANILKSIECHGSFATASCTKCKYQVNAMVIKEDIYNQVVPLCPKCHKASEKIENEDSRNRNNLASTSLVNGKSLSTTADTLIQTSYTITNNFNHKNNKLLLKDYHKDMSLSEENDDNKQGSDTDSQNSSISSSNPYFFDFAFQKSRFTLDNPNNRNGKVELEGNSLNINAAMENFKYTSTDSKSFHKFKSVMKPDIVFFGEGLSEKFHLALENDKELCDLLIVMGSSMKVRPVSLIPNTISPDVPQILVNKEPLPHLNFDIEFLGDCDTIISELLKRIYQKNIDLKRSNKINNSGKGELNTQEECSKTSTDLKEMESNKIKRDIEDSADIYINTKKGKFATQFDSINKINLKGPLRTEIYALDHILDAISAKNSSTYRHINKTFIGSAKVPLEDILLWDQSCELYWQHRTESLNQEVTYDLEDQILNLSQSLILVKLVALTSEQTEKISRSTGSIELLEISPILLYHIDKSSSIHRSLEEKKYALVNAIIPVHDISSRESNDQPNFKDDLKHKRVIMDSNSVVSGLPDNTFLFIPPNRYIFPDAEIKCKVVK